MVRSCCRCGKDFTTETRALVCSDCLKPELPKTLSFRERQIVQLISTEAASNKEIAFRLHLSEGTVKEYMNRIFQKIGIRGRGELIIWAIKHPDLTTGK